MCYIQVVSLLTLETFYFIIISQTKMHGYMSFLEIVPQL